MAQPSGKSKTLEFLLIFAALYLLTNFALRRFFPEQFGGEPSNHRIVLSAADTSVKGGHHPVLTLRNGNDRPLTLSDRCPMPPVDVFGVSQPGTSGETLESLTTQENAVPCVPVKEVPAGEEVTLDLGPWKYSLFGDFGTYQAELPKGLASQSGNVLSVRFDIYEEGVITKAFRVFVTKPFLNFLIFIAGVLPDHSLGIAIIILTILVKLLLFIPTQHAMEGQKRMQAVQPKIDAVREKLKNDPQKMQKEIMQIWKEHKVNPFQSCLPLLVQFPILIGLFYVIRDGSHLALSTHLIYEPYRHLDWTFNPHFLGLDLLQPSWYVFPPLLVILQFLQMKLTFAIAERKKQKEGKQEVIDISQKKEMSPQEMQQKMMLYGLPLMIGFFAFSFPAAVSLYWGVSTVFAIGQQLLVNRKVLR